MRLSCFHFRILAIWVINFAAVNSPEISFLTRFHASVAPSDFFSAAVDWLHLCCRSCWPSAGLLQPRPWWKGKKNRICLDDAFAALSVHGETGYFSKIIRGAHFHIFIAVLFFDSHFSLCWFTQIARNTPVIWKPRSKEQWREGEVVVVVVVENTHCFIKATCKACKEQQPCSVCHRKHQNENATRKFTYETSGFYRNNLHFSRRLIQIEDNFHTERTSDIINQKTEIWLHWCVQ